MNAPNADISGDLLFPVVESLSPRLAWMRKHGVITFSLEDDTWLAGFQAWHPTVTDAAQFFCDETGYQALKMGRRALGTELCLEYWKDSIVYLEMAERDADVPTLFDLAAAGIAKIGEAA